MRRRETRGVAAFAEVALGVSHTDSRHQRGSNGVTTSRRRRPMFGRLALFEEPGNFRLHDLAHRIARQCGNRLQCARHLVRRELNLRPLLELVE